MTGTVSIVFQITGEPKGQPRPRAQRRGKKVHIYTPDAADDWKLAIMASARSNRPDVPFSCPIVVVVDMFFPSPKDEPRHGELYLKKPDVDNAVKPVLDVLTELGFWKDDAQVYDLHVTKRYASEGEKPGALITIIAG